jgi:signal transduction histidine kinase
MMSRRETLIEQNVRRLVARELHDRVAQTLTGMLVDLENFKLKRVASEEVLEQFEIVQSSTREVLANLRQLLHDLRGEEQGGDHFANAIGGLIARFEEKTQIRAKLEVKPGWPDLLTPSAFLNLYRIVEEALSNVRMHSCAQSVRIVLEPYSEKELALVVEL